MVVVAEVDMSNDKMDVWEVDVETVCVAGGGGSGGAAADAIRRGGGGPMDGCSHAKTAVERRKQEQVESFLSKERESGIHWGNPDFDFTKEVDMNVLCARVVIYAQKSPAQGGG